MARRLAGLVLLGSMLVTTSAGVALPPITAAIDLLAMIAARSPGVREAGVLSNKKARVPLEAPGEKSSLWKPEAPIPDAVPLPPDAGAVPGAVPDASALGGPEAVGGTDHFGSEESFIGGPPGGGGFPIGGGPFGFAPPGGTPGNPGGGGGSPPGGGGGTTPPGNPPVTPVPEPGAWILMLASFALMGARLRLRPRRKSTMRCA
ncbi:hypothetical protein IAG41_11730 [Sphingomonas sp. JC676]|uniref:PEP-CTERM sorting domain-containing protein n=1 Tax=Sphingomonas sp. JC676 TaxID=2768065 RepID=UPI0016578C68|nr:PEP-CTERM sorting domain-containing protein [Sphingomonas sp. JC676]MBC9033065.1 hypothetical protein [Sphingomonas sp. JC676]